MSDMTDRDKAAAYDRIADYLRKNGWRVVRLWRHPGEGTMHESWRHDNDSSEHECDLMAAFTMERWKDAPRQGERLSKTLAALGETVNDKLVARLEALWRAGELPVTVEENVYDSVAIVRQIYATDSDDGMAPRASVHLCVEVGRALEKLGFRQANSGGYHWRAPTCKVTDCKKPVCKESKALCGEHFSEGS